LAVALAAIVHVPAFAAVVGAIAWSFDVGYQYILEYNKVTKKGKIERK
jgi:hypothetical protein